MNIKKNRLGFVALVVSSVMVLSACNGAGGNANYTEEQMKEKIVAAFEAMEDIESARSNISIEGNASQDEEEFFIDLDMGIAQEVIDKEEMKYNLDFDLSGNVSFEETNVGFSLALVVLEDAVYANLGEITGLEEDPNAAMFLPMLEGYMNQWWKFELPEGGLSSIGVPEDADITAQQEELLALLKDADLFETIEFVGKEKLGSNQTEKFNVELSQDGVIEYIREVSAITDPGVEITDEEVDEVTEALEGLDIETMVWITDDGYVAGMSVAVAGQVEDTVTGSFVDLDFDVVIQYTDFNENVKIEAPEDATLFDLGGLGMGAPMMGDPYAGGSGIWKANNAQRRSDVNALLNAIHQYSIDNGGELPDGIPTNRVDIGDRAGEADICDALVPTYLAALPTDPTDSIATYTSCDAPYNTGYTVMVNSDNRVVVAAPNAEGGEVISVLR